jgi:hypothetical protein
MKDEELKIEEMKWNPLTVSHTRRRGEMIHCCHTQFNTSVSWTKSDYVWVVITDAPVYMRERGGVGRGREGAVLRSEYTLLFIMNRQSES